MRTVFVRACFAGALFLLLPIEALAHGGGLNAEGCHTNRKTGEYHCHRQAAAVTLRGSGRSSSSAATASQRTAPQQHASAIQVTLDKVGRCHDPVSPGYEYAIGRQFASMDDCIKAGGENWRDAQGQLESIRSASDMLVSNGVVLRTHDGQCRSSWVHVNETLSNVTVFPTMEACLAAERAHGAKKQALAAGGMLPVTKKTAAGVCLDVSNPGYEETRRFDAFGSLEECLASGGRAPGK